MLDPNGILVARGYNRQSTPAVARGPDNWFALWSDSRAAGNNIQGTRITNGGQLQDNPALGISTAVSQQGTPVLAASGVAGAAAYMVAWSDHRGLDRDIYAARVQTSGAVTDPAGIAVAPFAKDQVVPAIASTSAGRFLVVWQDHRADGNGIDIRGAVITTAGAVAVADFPICSAGRDQQRPRVAWDPTSQTFLVVWSDTRTGPSDVYGARVTADGAVLDPGGVAISAALGGQLEPDVVFGFDRFLVAWRDGRTDAGDIYGARVRITATGITVDDPDGLAIAVQARKQHQPAVVLLERGTTRVFGIAWTDERNLETTSSDIYGAMITPATGAAFGAEHVLSATANHESLPALSPLRTIGNPLAVVVYQVRVPGLPQDRVFARRITYTEI